ncbi:TrkH family potassium uptake protein [Salinadaptatus halalkaliphilus]|uniref:TrkH family potassium uptake protein n=1 Tax=Salinadaptatus halalkaliphilus TaxID=2419781 RepID=A0A4S3TN90_9EURY|nr:TrkH family potassium uptake protein [Salinadaptatus halalkaliphilus]THE65646.1 TrkH family potassium uptake protein [Salinadaptatus halalkaliphilus]
MRRHLHVDWRAGLSLVGTLLALLSLAFVVPIIVALVYGGEDLWVFVTSLIITAGFGLALRKLDPEPEPGAREAFFVVALTWLLAAVFGALPYVLAGNGTLAHPVNALFESMSGFTTTGATVMGDISVDTHSRAMLMWRQLTQWLGGMGIIVLAVAILSQMAVGGAQLMEAETPGPGVSRLTPHIAETARVLWIAYIALTVLFIVLLYLLHVLGFAPNMDVYNAIAHGLTTLPTGGFSPEARSIEAFSPAVQWLVVPFMFAAGVNFVLWWHVISGDPRELLGDNEFRLYLGAVSVLSIVGTVVLFFSALSTPETGPVGGNLERSARYATFQIASLVNSTGYANMDFDAWSGPAKGLLLVAMLIGGSTGSTGGGIKVLRWLVILKTLRREVFTTIHPRAVRPVRMNGRVLDEDAVRGIYAFTLLYLVLFFVGVGLLALDAARVGFELELLDIISASIATLGNIGPGLGTVTGPMGGYVDFPASSKLLMIVYMWIGRLEIFPVLVLLTRAYWQD